MADRKRNATDVTNATNATRPSPSSHWSPENEMPRAASAAALKGRKIIAQGKAQRRPGNASHKIFPALQGRHNFGWQWALAMRRFCFALTGLDLFLANEPRALPWAIFLRLVGAGNGVPRAADAAGQTAPDGKGGRK